MKKLFSLAVQTQRALSHLDPQWEFLSFKKLASTNTYAKNNITQFTPPALVMAEHQLQGRGRGDNQWVDEGHGHQFLGTWVVKLNTPPDPRWTIALGYYAYACLHSTWSSHHFSMKAPNDLYLNNKKVGGILAEALIDNKDTFLLVGLGINVFGRPSSLHATAISLSEVIQDHVDEKSWQKFVLAFAKSLSEFENMIKNPDWLTELAPKVCVALNLNSNYEKNRVKDIKADGSIVLEQGFLNWLEL